jgi:hypothetical protein
MVAPEPTSAGRCGPKVQLTCQRVDEHSAPYLDLELICEGTWSSWYRQILPSRVADPGWHTLGKYWNRIKDHLTPSILLKFYSQIDRGWSSNLVWYQDNGSDTKLKDLLYQSNHKNQVI